MKKITFLLFMILFLSCANKQAKKALLPEEKVKAKIIVVVNGKNLLLGSFYVNSSVTDNWEDFVLKEAAYYIANFSQYYTGKKSSEKNANKNNDSKYGRDDANLSQDYMGKKSIEKDNKDKRGNSFVLGKDDLDKNTGKKGIGGTESSLLGKAPTTKKGTLSGKVALKSRRVIYRPRISLSQKYSKMGLSFTIKVRIVVNSEGIVTSANLIGSVGQPGLERIVVRYARRYRFEEISGGRDQTGNITFYIRPR